MEFPHVTVKQEYDFEYENNIEQAFMDPNEEEQSSHVIIKEEIDCDTIEDLGFELHPRNEICHTVLRRSTRKKCQRFSPDRLRESSPDEPKPTFSHKRRNYLKNAKLCRHCRKPPGSIQTLSLTATDISKQQTGEHSRPYPVCRSQKTNMCTLCCNELLPALALSPLGCQPLICDICGRSFRKLHHLKQHRVIHLAGRSFRSGAQEQCFKQFDSIQQQKTLHSVKVHVCKVCGRAFKSKTLSTEHMRIHTGERPYICDICDKSFRVFGNLKAHIRIHTGEKPYNCTVCDRAFSQRAHLSVHLRIHTGEKPFQCRVCGKAFFRSNNLRLHSRVHKNIGSKTSRQKC